MVRGVFADRRETQKRTLGDLFKQYLEEVSPQKKGGHSERYRLNALMKDPIARIVVADLSGKIMAQWRDRRLKEVTGSTTNRDLNLISHVINVARREWGMNVKNPVADIRRPPENRARNRRLSLSEEQRLLDALVCPSRDELGRLTGPSNPWVRPLVIVAIETAMRRSELLALRWEHVELGQSFARLLDSKNGEARDVPLSTTAVATISGLPRHVSGRVFPTTEAAVKKAFERAVARSGIKDLHFHDLRHEATSRLAERLSNVLELSAVTGHKTLSMLKRYYHPKAQDLAKKLG
jgi:integrase